MIHIESNAPRTMLLLGAAISGGDVMELAKKLHEADEQLNEDTDNEGVTQLNGENNE